MGAVKGTREQRVWRWTLTGTVVTALALWSLWAAQGMDSVCPAIYPAPESCSPDARFKPALFGTILVGGLFAAMVVATAMTEPPRRERVLKPLCAALVLAAVASVLATGAASGVMF